MYSHTCRRAHRAENHRQPYHLVAEAGGVPEENLGGGDQRSRCGQCRQLRSKRPNGRSRHRGSFGRCGALPALAGCVDARLPCPFLPVIRVPSAGGRSAGVLCVLAPDAHPGPPPTLPAQCLRYRTAPQFPGRGDREAGGGHADDPCHWTARSRLTAGLTSCYCGCRGAAPPARPPRRQQLLPSAQQPSAVSPTAARLPSAEPCRRIPPHLRGSARPAATPSP
jgi:hypothetical protein